MAAILVTQNIVDVKYVIAILVIVAIVLDALARLRQDTPWVLGRLVLESRIANPVSGRQVRREGLQRLKTSSGPTYKKEKAEDGHL